MITRNVIVVTVMMSNEGIDVSIGYNALNQLGGMLIMACDASYAIYPMAVEVGENFYNVLYVAHSMYPVQSVAMLTDGELSEYVMDNIQELECCLLDDDELGNLRQA